MPYSMRKAIFAHLFLLAPRNGHDLPMTVTDYALLMMSQRLVRREASVRVENQFYSPPVLGDDV